MDEPTWEDYYGESGQELSGHPARYAYRGFTIEGDDADGYYVHHHARAEDLGWSMTVEGAKKLADGLAAAPAFRG